MLAAKCIQQRLESIELHFVAQLFAIEVLQDIHTMSWLWAEKRHEPIFQIREPRLFAAAGILYLFEPFLPSRDEVLNFFLRPRAAA